MMQALLAKWATIAGMIESADRAMSDKANPSTAAGSRRQTLRGKRPNSRPMRPTAPSPEKQGEPAAAAGRVRGREAEQADPFKQRQPEREPPLLQRREREHHHDAHAEQRDRVAGGRRRVVVLDGRRPWSQDEVAQPGTQA